ncbi:MAG: hypothetical protein M1812_003080 [Candelaria pacifica]|nr:MAG: hypothetical protein M1812_003080 [Candelaria pacifica]
MPYSHHSHSGQFCGHADNSLEEMVQEAIARGMQVFALTEHMPRDQDEDMYPEELAASQTPADLIRTHDEFYMEAVRLRRAYSPKIHIFIGFECDWIRPSSRVLIENLLYKHTFDLFVGSIHHVHAIPIDYDRQLYEMAREKSGGTEEQLFQDYFDTQFEMLQALKPPIVGHFDLIRLKSDEPDGTFKRWDSVWPRINRNLSFIAGYGGIVELNSASLRKGMNEPYPKKEICEVMMITLSSTHARLRSIKVFLEAYNILRSAFFTLE